MPDHLNIYEPYERKGAGHEDALTRAFLLVLRGVPVAHAAWLHLVDHAHRANKGEGVPQLYELGKPAIHMQTATVPADVSKVISVVQTDEHVFRKADAKSTRRRQILDGVVAYNAFAIIVENKPFHGNIWEDQLDVNVPEGVDCDKRVATVRWRDIVTAWGKLRLAKHLGAAEGLLLGDFLDFVEEHFPRLRPFSKVGDCGTDPWRLDRRCKALLESIASGNVEHHRGWGWYIDLATEQCARKIGVFPSIDEHSAVLVVEFDPGDTMSQARVMYDQVAIKAVVDLLGTEGWSGWPNFHLLYMTSGFFRPGPRQSLTDYWKVWSENRDDIRQWRRAQFDEAFERLLKLGVVGEEHREEFRQLTAETKRDNVCFAPGVTLRWCLPLTEAAAIDARDGLEPEVRSAIEAASAVLKLKLRW